jgi:hypothetical protein
VAGAQRLYAGVVEADIEEEPSRYLAVRVGNAPIAFDDSLIPDVLGRGLLRDWLAALGDDYSDDTVDLVAKVQQATFYTPGRFCRANGKYTQGRHVCTEANVSPVFYTTYDAWSAQGCDGDTSGAIAPLPAENLVATTTVSNVGYGDPDHWLSVYAISGYPGESGCDGNCEHPSGWPFIWTRVPDNECPSANATRPWDIPENVSGGAACAHWAWQLADRPYYWPTTARRRLSHERLMPSQCSPAERVEMFLEKDFVDKAHAMQTLVQGLSLSCIRESLHLQTTLSEVPPAIESIEDIRALEAWLKRVGHAVDDIANLYYVVDLPTEVVEVALEGGSNVGAVTAGARGELLFELEKQLRLVESGFSSVGTTLQQIGTEIDKARLDLEAVGIGAEGQRLQLAAANIENNRQRALATVSMFMGAAKFLVTGSLGVVDGALQPGEAATALLDAEEQMMTAAVNLGAAESMDRVLTAQAQNSADGEENQEAQVVVTLSEAIAGLFDSIGANVTGVENGVSSILQTVAALHQNESKARIAVAKAAGADFVQFQDGSAPVPLHVNTVYRRQFNVLKKRYERALESARRSAYLARLSMEQRLGIRLDELHQGIGPLEAPAVWVDSLCTVQGVDYSKLRTAELNADPDEEDARIEGFADQYIGDYVAKLKEFLEFYTLEFPFRESEDVAVVSLREDLPGSLSSCMAEAPNLLCHSDHLDAKSREFGQPVQVATQGWGTTGCSEDACIEVLGGGALQNPVPMSSSPETVALAPPDGFGAVTWLRTIPRPLNTDPEVTEEEQDHQVWKEKSPAAIVYQTVSLRAGERYVLSWWDMARKADGGIALEADVRNYQAAAYDDDWKFLAGDSMKPPTPADGTTWEKRRQIEFVAYKDGDYHVAFSAGLPDVADASVAIANVQLESAPGNSGGATAYVPTSASRMRLTGQCPADSPEQFRSRFQHRCDKLGCWFELRDTLAIDTELLNQGGTSLLGQVAPGNFNYRTGGVAVNLVGTGILDCAKDGSSSCYGSGYVEYDLQHDAYSVPLEDYESNVRCFDFGAGNIRGGKALAAERFITLPMSSADKEMVNSSPFLKQEFSGRPLSGSYRLRIKDSPSLVWEQVDDVQVILNYNYWSRVERSPGN